MNAERCYKYAMPVTAVSFSSANSHLLAVGFYDGSICVVDIRQADVPELMVSERKSSPPIQPIWQIKFLKRNVSVLALILNVSLAFCVCVCVGSVAFVGIPN